MAILFISSVVPDSPAFHNAAFARSGNNVALGIIKSLSLDSSPSYLSFRPVPSFPHAPIWIRGESVEVEKGKFVKIAPTLNIKIIKNLFWNLYTLLFIIKWSLLYRKEKRNMLVYNIYIPSISILYKIARITCSKIFVILYDLGVPPKRLGLSKITMWAYKMGERAAKKYIPKIDGRILINEKISSYYAPNKDFILVEGGINDHIISNLFPIIPSKGDSLNVVLAGMLWDQNGTRLLLDTLSFNPSLNINAYFAGEGKDLPLIREASKNDKRIHYVGKLTLPELFTLYEKADVLLNLRIEEEFDFHFPSKVLEYLTTGRHVISTPIANIERDYGDFVTILNDCTPKGLSDTLEMLIKKGKHELCKIGVLAQQFMLEEKTWSVQTKKIEQYINSKN